jgi:pimeloyl-ACP methyl ester carboxylesterase
MPQAKNQDVALEYETFGDPNDPTLLLVMGLGAQMTAWHTEFCEQLAAANLHVVRFDNRDCGLSSKTAGDAPDVMALFAAATAGEPIPEVPYTLSDMADDAVAVLDAVGVQQAHVAGASMGGMITQQMAIDHPDRVASIISIMSTTGSPEVGQSEPEAITALLTPPPEGRDAAIERDVEVGRIISGPLFDTDVARTAATLSYDRSFYPTGAAFQIAAIAKGGDRTEALGGVSHRALVIHGAADPLITPSGGEATAAALPNSTLLMLDEMGHDLPRPLWDTFVGAITENIAG